MRTKRISKLIGMVSAWFLSFSSLQLNAESLSKRSNLSPSQGMIDLILKDSPLTDFSTTNKSIYFVGRDYLWQWTIDKGGLKRIRIGKAHDERRLFERGNYLWTFGDTSLLKIKKGDLETRFFRLPDNDSVRSLLEETDTGHLFAAGKQGFYKIIAANDILSKVSDRKRLTKKATIFGGEIFKLNRNHLTINNFEQTETRSQRCLSPHSLQAQNRDTLWIRCADRLIVKGQKTQRIRIAQGENLQAVYLDPSLQAFLFEDGKLEIYNLRDNTLRVYATALEDIKKFRLLGQSLVAISSELPFMTRLREPYHVELLEGQ